MFDGKWTVKLSYIGKIMDKYIATENINDEIRTGSKQAKSRVRSHNPETVVLSAESVKAGPLSEVPNTDALVLRVGKNQFLTRMKQDTRNVVVMAPASIHFPCLYQSTG